jgi:hypothetical protein
MVALFAMKGRACKVVGSLAGSASLLIRGEVVDDGEAGKTEVAKIERDDFATPEAFGSTLGEGKLLTAAAEAEIVRAQVAEIGEWFRWCERLWDEAS